MLPVILPSTTEGAGWHRAFIPVPHLLTPLHCSLQIGWLETLCLVLWVLKPFITLSVPSLVCGTRHQDLAWVPRAWNSTGAGAGRAMGAALGGAVLGRMVPPSCSSSHPTYPPTHPTQPRSTSMPHLD